MDQDWATWREFKRLVERRFGIDKDLQEDLFLHLARRAGEDALLYVQRVEDTRAKLGRTGAEALMKAWAEIPRDILDEIELSRRIKGVRGRARWEEVVELAKIQRAKEDSGVANARLVPSRGDPSAAGKSAARATPPPPRGRVDRHRHVGGHGSHDDNEDGCQGGTQAAIGGAPSGAKYTPGGNREPCWICEEIGGPGVNPKSHTWDQCFCNPQSNLFRADLQRYRLGQLRARGREPSAKYKALGQPKAAVVLNYRTIDDIAGQLAAVNVPEAIAWEVAETLVEKEQVREAAAAGGAGLIGHYRHLSDGILGPEVQPLGGLQAAAKALPPPPPGPPPPPPQTGALSAPGMVDLLLANVVEEANLGEPAKEAATK